MFVQFLATVTGSVIRSQVNILVESQWQSVITFNSHQDDLGLTPARVQQQSTSQQLQNQ